MLKKYRTIIYESEGEINKVIDNCINHVLKNHPECTKEEILDEDIEKLIAERQQARKDRNFAHADEIRDELLAKGIVLEDTREGVRWKRA